MPWEFTNDRSTPSGQAPEDRVTTDLFGNRSLQDTGERSAFDFYPTPSWATRSLVYHVPEIANTLVLECASGDGAIANVLHREFGCGLLTNDLDRQHSATWNYDATGDLFWGTIDDSQFAGRIDWIITNPPFNVAFPMLQQAVRHARVGVAFLLRKTFLEPTEERGEWLSNNPPSRTICLPRHNFRGEGTDSVPCDWFVWERTPVRNVFPIEIDYRAKARGKDSV